MDMTGLNIPKGAKLIKIHKYLYMHNGSSYNLEVDEYSDGMFAGHGEHAADESQQLKSVTGKTLNECLQPLIDNISS